MSPVADQAYREAYQPFSEDKISLETALERGTAPFRTFMLGQTRESDLALLHALPKSVRSKRQKMFQCGF